MKIKLTPKLAYLIGFWRKRNSYEGVGVKGEEKYLELFTKEVLDQKITEANKILTVDDKVYFHHTSYKKFFKQIEKEECERFKYLNEYAASYIAGIFDSVGEIDEEKGIVMLKKARKNDEIMLYRLGFGCKWNEGKLIITRPRAFLRFIKNYVKLYATHKIFKMV